MTVSELSYFVESPRIYITRMSGDVQSESNYILQLCVSPGDGMSPRQFASHGHPSAHCSKAWSPAETRRGWPCRNGLEAALASRM